MRKKMCHLSPLPPIAHLPASGACFDMGFPNNNYEGVTITTTIHSNQVVFADTMSVVIGEHSLYANVDYDNDGYFDLSDDDEHDSKRLGNGSKPQSQNPSDNFSDDHHF